jgi:hypothetical protein
MAVPDHERVGKALGLLRTGLGPFVEREVKGAITAGARTLKFTSQGFEKD